MTNFIYKNKLQTINSSLGTIRILNEKKISGIASVFPEPEDKEAFIKAQMYDTSYSPAIPSLYDYPPGTNNVDNEKSHL